MEPVTVVDYHTAGEPFRIVLAGAPAMEGATVLAKRAWLAEHGDEVRRLIINEPRGHADQYGCFVVEPDDGGAEFGLIFFHKDGYSTACGHGTIAAATWAFESGRVMGTEGVNHLVLDVPSGRVRTRVELEGGRVGPVTFVNVPAFVTATGVGLDTVSVDVSYGGAFYASVDSSQLGFDVSPTNVDRFIAAGRSIKAELAGHPSVEHPTDERLSGLYGVIFYDRLAPRHQRNITVFADGEVDRSPCGSGTSARLAVLHAAGELDTGTTFIHDSVIGSRFEARVVEETHAHGLPAVITEVTGTAHRTGTATFTLDPDDALGLGFQLR
jgi:proline racemase